MKLKEEADKIRYNLDKCYSMRENLINILMSLKKREANEIEEDLDSIYSLRDNLKAAFYNVQDLLYPLVKREDEILKKIKSIENESKEAIL